jgi:hypothetical protein
MFADFPGNQSGNYPKNISGRVRTCAAPRRIPSKTRSPENGATPDAGRHRDSIAADASDRTPCRTRRPFGESGSWMSWSSLDGARWIVDVLVVVLVAERRGRGVSWSAGPTSGRG